MLGLLIRFVVSAIVLWVIAMVVPGMQVSGFLGALGAAVAIALLGWAAEYMLGRRVSPQARGFTGFLTAAVVIYLTGLLVPGWLTVSVWGALIGAFIIGIVDAFVPTTLR
jgi:putative membrane protein